ncbi:MAG: uroporphyrinogen-III synthase [Candidatus Nitrosocaldus sp.]
MSVASKKGNDEDKGEEKGEEKEEEKNILITRSSRWEDTSIHSSSEIHTIITALKSKGYNLILHKTIDVVRDDEKVSKALARLLSSDYNFIVFMSVSAVRFMIDAMNASNLDPRMLNRYNVVAVGPSTRDELMSNGIDVRFIPPRYSSYGLIELFSSLHDERYRGARVFIPRSSEATSLLADALTSLGFKVEEEHIYRVVPSRHDGWKDVVEHLVKGSLHYIIFTSSSSVNAFFTILDEYLGSDKAIDTIVSKGIVTIAIGPLTSDTLKAYGLRSYVADEHTLQGTFKLLLKIIEDAEDNL